MHVEAVADLAAHQRDVRLAVEQALVGVDAELAELGGQHRRRHLRAPAARGASGT